MGAKESKRLPSGWLTDPENHFDEREHALNRLVPSWAKAAHALRTDMRFGHPDHNIRAMSLIALHETLEVHRRRFESGDTLELLMAVRLCAVENVPLPTWLANAYSEAFESFLKVGGAASLDAVFSSPTIPTDTPKKAAAARLDWQLGCEIMGAMWEVALKDEALQSLDEALNRVLEARRFGVGKTKARELFNLVEKSQIEYLRAMGSNMQTLSRTLQKRRKGIAK